jgi:hypothetical protein
MTQRFHMKQIPQGKQLVPTASRRDPVGRTGQGR